MDIRPSLREVVAVSDFVRPARLFLSAFLSLALSTALVPPAFAADAAEPAAPSPGEPQIPSVDKGLSAERVLSDMEALEANADYEPGTLLALIDGDAEVASAGVTLKELAGALDGAGGNLSGGAESIDRAGRCSLSPASAGDAGDPGILGDIEPVAAGDWLGGLVLARVPVPEGMGAGEAASLLAQDGRVVDFSLGYVCSPEYVSEGTEVEVATGDPIYGELDKQWHLAHAAVPGAWSYMQNPDGTRARGGVTVAVIDSGCDLDHPDLVGNLDLANAYDAVAGGPLEGDVLANVDAEDGGESIASHGTHVCGIVGAETGNGIGTAGVSYDARVLPINAIDPATGRTAPGAIEAAFDYLFGLIDSGEDSIRVVNISLGSRNAMPTVAAFLGRALDEYGLTVVASAGNGASSAAHYPSDYEQCISVVCANAEGRKDPNSNYGPGTDVSAPGFHVWSTVDGGGYGYKTGTSMAAAIVSGVAALLYTMDPGATPRQVRGAVVGGAEPLPDPEETAAGMVSAADAMELLLFGVDYGDVGTEEWYVTGGYFTYVARAGIMRGYSGTSSFGPYLDVTRAEFATVLYRMANPGSGATTDPSLYEDDETGFSDAVDREYYTAALNWAKREGIMTGDASSGYTTVRPNDSLSRQEAAVMSRRFAGSLGADVGVEGMAIPALEGWDGVAEWARDAMTWCYHREVITGWDNRDGTFSALPLKTVDRSQMTKIATVLDIEFAK